MSVRDPRRLVDLCGDVEACIDASGVAELLEGLLPRGGRPREISVRTFLVGMLLAVRAGMAPHIEKARWVLSELPAPTRRRLGVIRESGEEITYKQMADMAERLTALVDSSPHFRGEGLTEEECRYREDLLIEVCDKLLAASIPDGVPHAGSYSIDGTNVDSWARPRTKIVNTKNGSIAASHLEDDHEERKKWAETQKKRRDRRRREWPDPTTVRPNGVSGSSRKPRASTTKKYKPNRQRKRWGVADPDSARYEKDGWKRDGKFGFGLEMHSFVMVSEEGEPSIPPFTRHLQLTPHRPENRTVVVEMAKRMAMMGEPLSDAVYDAGYGQYSEINQGLRRAGFDPVFDLWTGHLGVNGQIAGAIVIDGGLYSPGIPKNLRDLRPPPVGTGMKTLNHYQELIEERQRYALRRLGARPDADGTIRYQCPAAAGRVACPIKPSSLGIVTSKGLIVPSNVPAAGAQGDVCRQSSVTIDLDDPLATDRAQGYVGGLYQKHPFGSDAHYDSMRRRAYVEGAFGNIKSEAEQSLRRPSIRVVGRAKVTLFSVMVVVAANLRMGRLWQARQNLLGGGGPTSSPVMRAAAQNMARAEARRKRAARRRGEVRRPARSPVRTRAPD